MEAPLIRYAAPDDPHLVQFVELAAAGFTPDLERVRRDLADGVSSGFLVEAAGLPVAGFVLGEDDGYLVIEAAGGRAAFDLVGAVLPRIEACAAAVEARGVRVQTYRRGLVEKLGRAGYETQFVTMARTL